MSPKKDQYYQTTKPFNLQSPKSPKSNATFVTNSPKYLNSTYGYSNFASTKIKTSPPPTSILEKLRRQKAEFNDFKTIFL